MPSYTTRPTTTTTEIDQALAGVSADVTAANLSELTGGGETSLHRHAGGGATPYQLVYEVWNGVLTSASTYIPTLDPASNTVYEAQNEGYTLNPAKTGYLPPVAGVYLVTVRWAAAQHATAWTFQEAAPQVESGGVQGNPGYPLPPLSAGDLGPRTMYFAGSIVATYGADDVVMVGFRSNGQDSTLVDAVITAVYLGPSQA